MTKDWVSPIIFLIIVNYKLLLYISKDFKLLFGNMRYMNFVLSSISNPRWKPCIPKYQKRREREIQFPNKIMCL